MEFWFYTLFISLVIPAVMFFLGIRYKKNPPANVERLTNFRTPEPAQDPEVVKSVNKFCGRLWRLAGLIFFALSVCVMLILLKGEADMIRFAVSIICCVQIIALIAICVVTNIAVKKSFEGKEK